MLIFVVIVSILLWIAAFLALPKRILVAPALSYCALIVLSFAKYQDYPAIPLPNNMLISWLCITLVVMLIILLQNPALRQQSRGVGYMTIGGIVGMTIGLMAFAISSQLNLLYAIMMLATAAGIFLGLLTFSRTPDGSEIAIPTGRFFKYLIAKGFPILITIAQLGIPIVILIASFYV